MSHGFYGNTEHAFRLSEHGFFAGCAFITYDQVGYTDSDNSGTAASPIGEDSAIYSDYNGTRRDLFYRFEKEVEGYEFIFLTGLISGDIFLTGKTSSGAAHGTAISAWFIEDSDLDLATVTHDNKGSLTYKPANKINVSLNAKSTTVTTVAPTSALNIAIPTESLPNPVYGIRFAFGDVTFPSANETVISCEHWPTLQVYPL